MVQKALAVVAIVVSIFALGCSTKSSGGGTPGAQGDQGGGAQALGRNQSLCVSQLQNSNVILCTNNTSDQLTVEVLEQRCAQSGGQVAAQCPGTNVVVTCLIPGTEGVAVTQALGTPDQRNDLVQLCQQNGGRVQ